MSLQGKVAVITGGGAGIGRATALALAKEGVKVVIGNRNVAQGEDVVKAIRDAGGSAVFQKTDVSDPAQVKSLVQRAVSEFGAVNLAFNNSGMESEMKPLHEVDLDVAARV